MKALLTSLLTLVATCSFADLAVYNGVQVVKTLSLDGTSTLVEKTIEVVDLENSSLVMITLGFNKATRQKTFSVAEPAAVLIASVQDSRGNNRSTTTFSQAESSTDATTGIKTVGSFLQSGGDLKVTIKGQQKTSLPRNMHSAAFVVSSEGSDTGGPIASAKVETVATYVLQEATSRTSNDAGDTLQQAVDRITADLIAKGYVSVTP